MTDLPPGSPGTAAPGLGLEGLQNRLGEIREKLRDRARARPSMVLAAVKVESDEIARSNMSSANLMETMAIVEEYGPLTEAMYLVMAADRRVVNIEREVLRGALDLLSGGRVRTTHMEAMLDASAKRIAAQGVEARLDAVMERLAEDPTRAEMTAVLAAVVAAADGKIVPEEEALLRSMFDRLGLDGGRTKELLEELFAKG